MKLMLWCGGPSAWTPAPLQPATAPSNLGLPDFQGSGLLWQSAIPLSIQDCWLLTAPLPACLTSP